MKLNSDECNNFKRFNQLCGCWLVQIFWLFALPTSDSHRVFLERGRVFRELSRFIRIIAMLVTRLRIRMSIEFLYLLSQFSTMNTCSIIINIVIEVFTYRNLTLFVSLILWSTLDDSLMTVIIPCLTFTFTFKA